MVECERHLNVEMSSISKTQSKCMHRLAVIYINGTSIHTHTESKSTSAYQHNNNGNYFENIKSFGLLTPTYQPMKEMKENEYKK